MDSDTQQKSLQLDYIQSQKRPAVNNTLPRLPSAPVGHQPTVKHPAFSRGSLSG